VANLPLVPGQAEAIAAVEGALKSGSVPPTWLFSGPEGTGKWALAHAFARARLCERPGPWSCGECGPCRRAAAFSHGDLFLLFGLPTGGGTGKARDKYQAEFIEDFLPFKRDNPLVPYPETRNRFMPAERISELLAWAYLKPGEGKHKVAIVYEAELILRTVVDKLLKLTEEPPPNTTLVLVAHQPEKLPATIRSRARQIRFKRTGPRALKQHLVDMGIPAAKAAAAARQARGCIGVAITLLDQTDDGDPESQALLLLGRLLAGDSHALGELQVWQWQAQRQRAQAVLDVWAALIRDLAVGRLSEPLLAAKSDKLARHLGSLADPETASEALELVRETQASFDNNVHIGAAFVALASRLGRLGSGAPREPRFWPAAQKV
jgi:DNA polymerase-3 subunit delta'